MGVAGYILTRIGLSMKIGQLWIIAAASGTGKTSLVKALLSHKSNLRVSVSHTTRPPRPMEINGKDYHFVDIPTYQRMVTEHAFLEHAMVFDNGYGTAKTSVETFINAGQDVLLEIDWQGAQQVRTHWPNVKDIFILPPSLGALEQRLRHRASDAEEVIQRRLRESVTELSHYHEFRYCVVNDSFEQALLDLIKITNSEADDFLSSRPAIRALAHNLISQ